MCWIYLLINETTKKALTTAFSNTQVWINTISLLKKSVKYNIEYKVQNIITLLCNSKHEKQKITNNLEQLSIRIEFIMIIIENCTKLTNLQIYNKTKKTTKYMYLYKLKHLTETN